MGNRIALLFGAGASVDAGLKQTTQLAEEVVRLANQNSTVSNRRNWLACLNFVYGSMVDAASREGENPLISVNFERLVSALRILQNIDVHEVSPFVLSWKPGAKGFDRGNDVSKLQMQRAIQNLISETGTWATNDFIELIKKIANNSQGGKISYELAEKEVLRLVGVVLRDHQDTSYLKPMTDLAAAQEDGLAVLTLNYDLVVENSVAAAKCELSYGFKFWEPGVEIEIKNQKGIVNLIKMHGSLNWESTNDGRYDTRIEVRPGPCGEPVGHSNLPEIPWIVLGDREKLSTKGPTLPLLQVAKEALEAADHLVIAGYSFNDEHVNDLILAWLKGQNNRTIGVVDPGFKNILGEDNLNREGFMRYLMRHFTERIKVVEKSTKDGLEEAIHHPEAGQKKELYSVQQSNCGGDMLKITITSQCDDFRAAFADPIDEFGAQLNWIDLENGESRYARPDISNLAMGQSATGYVDRRRGVPASVKIYMEPNSFRMPSISRCYVLNNLH